MAGITLAQAETRLSDYLAAEAAVLSNQSYSISTGSGSRQLTRADLGEIREGIKVWDERARALDPARTRTRYIVPDTQ